MKESEKIRILLPHWIEHNNSHMKEFEKWAGIADDKGMADVAGLIKEAAVLLEKAGEVLSSALEKAGGPLEDSDAGHTHHHHHHHH